MLARAATPQRGSSLRTRRTGAPAASALAADLVNNTGSDTVYAHVTGQAVDNGNAPVLLEAGGQTPYSPSSPSAAGTPLAAGCSIPLNASGGAATPVTGSAGSGIDSQWQYETGRERAPAPVRLRRERTRPATSISTANPA